MRKISIMIMCAFAVVFLLLQNAIAEISFEPLLNEAKTIKDISSITGISEKDLNSTYARYDFKQILLAKACGVSLRDYLDPENNGFPPEMPYDQIMNCTEMYRNDCERALKVKINKGIYTDVDKGALAESIIAALAEKTMITNNEKRLIQKDDLATKCFGKKLTLTDSLIAVVISAKTGKDLYTIIEKRLNGTDWETLIYACKTAKWQIKSNSFSWGYTYDSQSGVIVQWRGALNRVNGKRRMGKISVDDLDGVLSACESTISSVKVPQGYREMSADDEAEALAQKIGELIGVEKNMVKACIQNSDKLDTAVKVAMAAKKAGKDPAELIKEVKKYPTFGLFCKQYLKLETADVKEINDKADEVKKKMKY